MACLSFGDHGDEVHRVVTTRAGQGVRLVDLLDQACPCGAAVLGRHRERGRPSCRCGNNRCRQRDRPRCPSATGWRTMYWASASRVLAQPAGMRIDASTLETTVSPLQHVLGQPLVQELALQEERDDGSGASRRSSWPDRQSGRGRIGPPGQTLPPGTGRASAGFIERIVMSFETPRPQRCGCCCRRPPL